MRPPSYHRETLWWGIRLDDEHLAERRLPTRHELDGSGSRSASDSLPILRPRSRSPTPPPWPKPRLRPEHQTPFGGAFDREDDGAPNGILRENAVSVVGDMCGDRASGMTPDSIAAASRYMATMGLTSVGAMVTHGQGLWADASSELDLMLAAAPELAITMNTMVMTTDVKELEEAKERIDRGGRRMRFLGVKVITDGSLGGRTAAMDDGYSDLPGRAGHPQSQPRRDARRVAKVDRVRGCCGHSRDR